MRLPHRLAALLLGCCLTGVVQAEPLQPFGATSLGGIEAAHAREPFVLVLWSVDCPPCFAELKMLGELRRERSDLRVVLLAADAPAAREDALLVLQDYGLTDAESWQFAEDFPEKLRHAVDPAWYGELPRSYFYGADGQRRAHSGMLSRAMLETWLAERS